MTIKASGTLLLFLVAGAIVLQHGSATTTSSTESDECFSESEACLEDTECNECFLSGGTNFDAYTDCLTADTGAAAFSCAARSKLSCCLDFASDNDCLGNDIFVASQLCTVNTGAVDVIPGVDVEECVALDCTGIIDSMGEGLIGDDDDGADDGTDDLATNTTSSTEDEGIFCISETQSCAQDPECLECISPTTEDELNGLADCLAGNSTTESSALSCASRSASACCLDAASANNCLENDNFVAHQLCSVNSVSLNISVIEVEECAALDCSAVDTSGDDGVDDDVDDAAGDDDAGDDAVGDEAVATGGAAGVGGSLSIAVLTLVLVVPFLTAAPLNVL